MDNSGALEATTASPATSVQSAVLRAVARPQAQRWSPLLATSASGEVLGQVTVESMVTALAHARPES